MKTISVIAAGAVAFGAVTTPVASADEAPATVPAVESGQLNWPIKESFIHHVDTSPLAKGVINTTDGAEKIGKDFTFPVDAAHTTLDAEGNGTIGTQGTVHIQGYPGFGPNGSYGVDLTFSDIKVEVAGQNATITADYKLTGASGPLKNKPVELSGDDAAISTFTLTESLVPETGKTYATTDAPTSLTQTGSDIFLGKYPVGQPLDDANSDLTVAFDGASENAKPSDQVTPEKKPSGDNAAADGSSFHGSSFGTLGETIAAVIERVKKISAFFSDLVLPGLSLSKFV
ncbi:HtaA domain-containing protein [Corynebacterium rhinophilum]|uniref:HtaA domain-containing protein n=1 Tax=Corynebacterium rhinophilum TaxID=3050197 RepID=UPI002550D998|nr:MULTISPECIES: HtaA domain-containing protein [unclassified Corynebacterium]MDK8453643.1 HtaA domain-containing protein [Corynebacterium sp. MSK084]MDK8492460.1 HtaA domain-containing protein [Corynebacterium sp. MSK175]MDK8515574.1 HtaA domain-containing protein [Corynebacterium sp. MSK123]MDK8548795.1 HtaA domain-containing protein [Corynebacterium sp. MSK222]MDK8648476.1 HtaA domain-containing protein [Corynebacterium sp. MSK082]